jgi:hypothetical protein
MIYGRLSTEDFWLVILFINDRIPGGHLIHGCGSMPEPLTSDVKGSLDTKLENNEF